MSKIVLENFNEGNGYYKVNLAYLSKEQVEEIESLVSTWNPTDEDIKTCIGMCLTDANEQRFKDYGTNLKDCLAWIEKQGEEEINDDDKAILENWESIVKENKEKWQLSDWFVEATYLLIQKVKHANTGMQGEQKPADKVESKFNVGDWITNSIETVQITGYDIDYGYQVNYKGNLQHRDTDIIEKEYHLWTIRDAKDGDVLMANAPFIFNGNLEGGIGCPGAHCGINTLGNFKIPTNKKHWTGHITTPATKEQRDLLFQKIKEAGYKWDEEKKELKKIESKFKVGNWYQCTKDFFGKGVTFDKNTAYYCAKEGCLQCEYGCHIAIVKDLYDNFKLWTIQDAKDGDVLVASDGSIFLFAGVVDCACKYYVSLTTDNYIKINKEAKGGFWETSRAVYPSTKEQRDILFAKIKENGYEWDEDKKELKKIEDIDENQIKKNLQDNSFRRMFEQNSIWNEEDERRLNTICSLLEDLPTQQIWLKGLKDRMQLLQKVTCNKKDKEKLEKIINKASYNCCLKNDDISFLKSLKQRIGE